MISRKHILIFILLSFLLVCIFCMYLRIGSSLSSWNDVYNAFFSSSNDSSLIIIKHFRLPRILMAFLAGASLSVAGMLMQNLFSNPLAGPYILGINSGASLFVAIAMLTGIPFFTIDLGIAFSGIFGALIFGGIILFFAFKVRSSVHLLLVGIMLGSLASALTSILESTTSADALKSFVFWNFGTLQNVTIENLSFIAIVVLLTVFLSLFLIKSMNALVLGESAAKALGINMLIFRNTAIILTAILSGTITAFAGPIAFVGLAIPNLSKMVFKTQNHTVLLFSNIVLGALFLSICDLLIVCLQNYISIPLNALTSFVGVPFVIWMILKNKNDSFQ